MAKPVFSSAGNGSGFISPGSAPSGSDRLLIYVTVGEGGTAPTAVTYGGQSLTFLEGNVSTGSVVSNQNCLHFWYLLETGIAAASGTAISVTHGMEPFLDGGYLWFTDVDQTNPFSTTSGDQGSGGWDDNDGATGPGASTSVGAPNPSADEMSVMAGAVSDDMGAGPSTAHGNWTVAATPVSADQALTLWTTGSNTGSSNADGSDVLRGDSPYSGESVVYATVAGITSGGSSIEADGTLSGTAGTTSGTAIQSEVATGTASGTAATTSGTAVQSEVAAGTASGSASTMTGEATAGSVLAATGTLSGTAGTTSGVAAQSEVATGTASGTASTHTGTGLQSEVATGTLSGAASTHTGTATATSANSIVATGTLSGTAGTTSGVAIQSEVATGTLAASAGTTSGVATILPPATPTSTFGGGGSKRERRRSGVTPYIWPGKRRTPVQDEEQVVLDAILEDDERVIAAFAAALTASS